jgi:hypothetical protein
MARLLVDMNLSTEWIPLLTAAGHDLTLCTGPKWAIHGRQIRL